MTKLVLSNDALQLTFNPHRGQLALASIMYSLTADFATSILRSVAQQSAPFLRFLDHTNTHTYTHTHTQFVAEAATYTTHIKHKRRTFIISAGFKAAIPVIKRQ